MALKELVYAIVFGWGVWAGISILISRSFNVDIITTYFAVGVSYIIILQARECLK